MAIMVKCTFVYFLFLMGLWVIFARLPETQKKTESSATAEIARVGGRYAVQITTRSLMLAPKAHMRVNDANFYPVSRCFQLSRSWAY